MMTTTYDPEADAMSVWFGDKESRSADTREVAPGVILDFDAEGRLLGIEVLYVSKRGDKSIAGRSEAA